MKFVCVASSYTFFRCCGRGELVKDDYLRKRLEKGLICFLKLILVFQKKNRYTKLVSKLTNLQKEVVYTINLGMLIKKSSNQLSKEFDHFAKHYELTGMQMSVIDFLGRRVEQITLQKDVEAEFLIQKSTATTILQRMEKKQFLTRQALATDARQKAIVLAPKALALLPVITEYMQKQQAIIINQFSESEVASFQKMLNCLIEKGD